MKQLFDISFPEKEIIQPVLALQLGAGHFAFAIADRSTGQLKKLTYFTTDVLDGADVDHIFSTHSELSETYFQVRICYLFHEASLIPARHFFHEHQSTLLRTLHGTHPSMNVIAEFSPGKKLNTVYVVPGRIYQQLSSRFPGAKYWHSYSIALKSAGENALRLDFRQNDFSAVAYEKEKMLFAGSFTYSTPADVLYIILKIVHSFQLSQQETSVQISGLIDQDSALYKEMLQYFLNVEFREAPWYTGYPEHYFTSLNELLQCE